MKNYVALFGLLLGGLYVVPAYAQVDVTVGGYTSNYVGWADQDTLAGADVKSFDMLRDSELHFRAEGKTDSGLTYGFLVEALVDGPDGFGVQESYLYLSNQYGKVILGSEDGASYALQVSAPSADSNIDGLRQYINPLNYGATAVGGGSFLSGGVDYAARATGKNEKITYLTPVWSGLQLGVSYTPDVTDASTNVTGFNNNPAGSGLNDAYEAGIRYQGEAGSVKYKVGGGYTTIEQETNAPANDDVDQWNVGADLDIGDYGVGAAYVKTENNLGVKANDTETIVVGVDYKVNDAVKVGASYYTSDFGTAVGDIDIDRYTAGVNYTIVDGLSLRGSVSFIEHDLPGAFADVDGTSVMTGIVLTF